MQTIFVMIKCELGQTYKTAAHIADVVDEAAFWAGRASREELRAYLLACYRALSTADQTEFLSFAHGRAAA